VSENNLSKVAVLFGRLGKLAVSNPRGLREVAGIALATTDGLMDSAVDVLPIPTISLETLIGEGSLTNLEVKTLAFPRLAFSIMLLEAVGLGVLIRMCNASRVFEFGTHRGISTSQLAANLPAGGHVFTLDLPRSDTKTHFKVDDWAEQEVANYPRKGDLIPEELRKQVTFLEQDSALFDPKPYLESMDFVFVDAAHTREYVINDSEKAWAMLKPGGIVAWHDCRAQSPEVSRYLRSCSYKPRRISDTTLAFAIKPK